jgi:hypothetical protein
MNTFLDALRECIGWHYNHTQPFVCRSLLFESRRRCRIARKLLTADCHSCAISRFLRPPIFLRQLLPPCSTRKVTATALPFLKFLISMNYSATHHENPAISVVLHDPLDTSASRNLIDTTKQFHRVTRLYGVQPVGGCCRRIEGFQKIPRGGSRGALTRIFPAVSPGRGGVVRGRLLGPVRRVNFFDPAACGLAADSI